MARETEENSQEVLRLDGDVVKQEELVRQLEGDVETATRVAEAARGELDKHRGDISEFARQRMRGDVVDPITAVIGSSDAQDALDRSSYVNRMSRDSTFTLFVTFFMLRSPAVLLSARTTQSPFAVTFCAESEPLKITHI